MRTITTFAYMCVCVFVVGVTTFCLVCGWPVLCQMCVRGVFTPVVRAKHALINCECDLEKNKQDEADNRPSACRIRCAALGPHAGSIAI